MLELPDGKVKNAALELRKEMLDRKSRDEYLWPEEMQAYLEAEDGFEFVGSGSKTVVFAPKATEINKDTGEQVENFRKDIVIAADFNKLVSADEAKRVYYVHKILKTLFPHNFPKILAVFGGFKSKNSDVSGSIRQRIYPSENPEQKVRYPISEVEKAIEELGLPIDKLDYTFDASNFTTAEDGGQYYVDTLSVRREMKDNQPVWPEWDLNRITDWMKNEGYKQKEIDTVLKSVARIEEFRGV